MAQDLEAKNVIGHVPRFKLMATDGGVGAAEVAWFQGWSKSARLFLM
jgi:hypothetical protein